jgi:hypothetical protein
VEKFNEGNARSEKRIFALGYIYEVKEDEKMYVKNK